ncbi:MAG: response regulator [Paracoccaceae bacterium]
MTQRRHRVLIAEDNMTNSLIVRKMLEPENLELILVENGRLAVESYERQPPDIVLMDMSMPVMDGLQAAREIRRIEARDGLPRVPMVALTANAFSDDRDACIEAGLDDFLTKPISKPDLTERIRAHLSSAQEAISTKAL